MDRTRPAGRRRFLQATAVAAVELCPPLREAATVQAAEATLLPGQVIRLEFPELPRTLRAVNDPKSMGPTTVSVRLPDNYTKDRAFPLFVFLHGGQGSTGSEVHLPMEVVGKNDYVVATFPLFKKEINRDEQWGGVGIDCLDYPVLSGAYKTILEKIGKAIPNLDTASSVLGGYSNGGHALAMLLSALDPTLLKSFGKFYFIDAGLDWTGYARYKSLGAHDILFVIGGGNGSPEWYRPAMLSRLAYFKEVAQRYKVPRWQFVVAEGATHGDLDQFFPRVREWVVGKAGAAK